MEVWKETLAIAHRRVASLEAVIAEIDDTCDRLGAPQDIRILAGALGLDLGGAIAEKMAFNAVRPDHKLEARAAAGGKAY